MEYRTTNCERDIVGILCTEPLQLNARLRRVASRREKRQGASIRPGGRVLKAGFIATLIGLFIHINILMPVSSGPANVMPLPVTEPVAAQQGWRISSVSIPILGAPVTSIEVDSPDAMVAQLKELGLWELETEESSEVPPVVFTNFPNHLSELNVDAKKRIFLHSLLPVALVAMAEVKQERAELQTILGKFDASQTIVFSDELPDWQKKLSQKEKIFIGAITEKYRTQKAAVLLDRIDVLPVSLVLAQGAFESFWGTSRFAREGNNLFGMWTWGEEGIIPARRDAGKTHKLAVYDSILDAVRNFVLTINRLPAYKKLRKIRHRTMDSMTVADGLYYYSERGNAYIADVKTIIQHNGLARYDGFVLGNSADLSPASTGLASL